MGRMQTLRDLGRADAFEGRPRAQTGLNYSHGYVEGQRNRLLALGDAGYCAACRHQLVIGPTTHPCRCGKGA